MAIINSMIDSVVRCVKCGAKMGGCACWSQKPPSIDDATNAILEIADAAKAWRRNKRAGEARLKKAVDEWIKCGG